ncbi:MAG: hypothetical protein F4Y67_06255 [Chloroflexi bacterium]|nr:hypothetical protein [Chloroflexota bacterium]MXY00405.1 hypothetical protein [Chloroflexota bacterium]
MRQRRPRKLSNPGRGRRDAAGAIAELLSERELALFRRMSRVERLIARFRFRYLRGRDIGDADRQRALLLRDVGKGRPGLIQRVLVVLLAASPGTMARWRRRDDNSYLAQVARLARHSEAGAELLRLAGSNNRVIEMVRTRDSR